MVDDLLRATHGIDRGARRAGARIVDKWYDFHRDLEWRELAYESVERLPVGTAYTSPLLRTEPKG